MRAVTSICARLLICCALLALPAALLAGPPKSAGVAAEPSPVILIQNATILTVSHGTIEKTF